MVAGPEAARSVRGAVAAQIEGEAAAEELAETAAEGEVARHIAEPIAALALGRRQRAVTPRPRAPGG